MHLYVILGRKFISLSNLQNRNIIKTQDQENLSLYGAQYLKINYG